MLRAGSWHITLLFGTNPFNPQPAGWPALLMLVAWYSCLGAMWFKRHIDFRPEMKPAAACSSQNADFPVQHDVECLLPYC
jgi:hypothetical protein